MWLSGTWCTTCRTVQPPGRYGVSSSRSDPPLHERAEPSRRLFDGVDVCAARGGVERRVGSLEAANGITKLFEIGHAALLLIECAA